MRYDLTVPLKDLSGGQIADPETPEGYTLRSVLVRTALARRPGKVPTAAQARLTYGLAKRFALANRYIDLTPDEVDDLKAKAAVRWSPLVLDQLWELIEAPVTLWAPRAPTLPAADIPPQGSAPLG